MLPEQCLQAIEIARDADGVARHVHRHPIPVGVARKLAQPVDDLAADCQVELMDEPGFLRKGNDLERALAGIRVEPAERLEIGSASCRESVCQYGEISGVAVSLKKKETKT